MFTVEEIIEMFVDPEMQLFSIGLQKNMKQYAVQKQDVLIIIYRNLQKTHSILTRNNYQSPGGLNQPGHIRQ